MKKLALLMICMMIVSGCNNGNETAYELCGDGPMMVIEGKEYLRLDAKKKVTLGEQLGKIKEQIDGNYHPVEDFSSNTLAAGSTIFRVKGQDHYLVAKTNNEKYVLFELID
ncbi:hypothetical protein [Bacillus sp. Marseille-Q1617]|uniref:hypothetical protein n=1 Tax=Bacillus sp. Marseille-Q1617 TaxID=2736887 RepID=UPI00158D7C9B|nr:hypothetical protein [Bacillus sp. Marseille-Q1617]